MKGDFSRWTFDQRKHYAGVLHQQGRVWLDSDWNEDIIDRQELLRQETSDIVGTCGVPDPGTAFRIEPNPDPNSQPDDFVIVGGPDAAGHAYVHGLLCQLEESASYLHQPDFPDPPRISLPTQSSPPASPPDQSQPVYALVYLEAWQRLITYLEDDELREIALGGPDTATRLKTIAQVKILPLPTPPRGKEEPTCASASTLLLRPDWGTLTTLVPQDTLPPDPCRIPDPGTYTGRENHLYRVEIHDGGDALDVLDATASRAFRFSLAADANAGTVTVTLAQALEPEQLDALNRAGVVLIQDADGQSEIVPIHDASGTTLNLARGLSHAYTMAKHATIVGGVARFKWSRDNAACAVRVLDVRDNRQTLALSSLGRDQATALQAGDLVEICDDASELGPARGHLTTLSATPDPDLLTVSLVDPLPSAFTVARHLLLRRWDGWGWVNATFDEVSTPDMNLGDGIHIQFGGSNLQPGDYWIFTARSADGSVESLTNAAPAGITRYRCPLAIVRWRFEVQFQVELIARLLAALNPPAEQLAQIVKLLKASGQPFWSAEAVEDLARRAGLSENLISALRERLAHAERGESVLRLVFTVLEDCRQLFPPLTKLTHLYYVSGDGQEAPRGEALPQPLQVGVANGPWPVGRARVRLQITDGNGTLRAGADAGRELIVQTGADGVAECTWQLDATTPSQRVEASLVAGAALPVRFNASFAQAGEREPGIHVKGVFLVSGQRLPIDNDVSVDALAQGIRVECDDRIDARTISQPTCFVTLDMPFPFARDDQELWGGAVIGFQPLILAADPKVDDNVILWNPTSVTRAWLLQLFDRMTRFERGDRVLAHLTLKGNFIWAQDNPELFLDGEVFGVRQPGTSNTDLRLPSGDGPRGGDFEMWFRLVRGGLAPGIGLLPNLKNERLSNADLRNALSLAIDRPKLLELGFLPPGYQVDSNQPFDPDTALAIVQSLGLMNQSLDTQVEERHQRLAAQVHDMVKEFAHLDLRITTFADGTLVERVRRELAAGADLNLFIADEAAADQLAGTSPDNFAGSFIRF
jgi:hypothetical protein